MPSPIRRQTAAKIQKPAGRRRKETRSARTPHARRQLIFRLAETTGKNRAPSSIFSAKAILTTPACHAVLLNIRRSSEGKKRTAASKTPCLPQLRWSRGAAQPPVPKIGLRPLPELAKNAEQQPRLPGQVRGFHHRRRKARRHRAGKAVHQHDGQEQRRVQDGV